jgi:hypothetical protein
MSSSRVSKTSNPLENISVFIELNFIFTSKRLLLTFKWNSLNFSANVL